MHPQHWICHWKNTKDGCRNRWVCSTEVCNNVYSLVRRRGLFNPSKGSRNIQKHGSKRGEGWKKKKTDKSDKCQIMWNPSTSLYNSPVFVFPCFISGSRVSVQCLRWFSVFTSPISATCFDQKDCDSSSHPGPNVISLRSEKHVSKQAVNLNISVPLWWSAAAAAAAAASRCALSSFAASWAPSAPDRASKPEPPPSARPGWGSPDGCGPTGKPWACWERCWAWSCCCREEGQDGEVWVTKMQRRKWLTRKWSIESKVGRRGRELSAAICVREGLQKREPFIRDFIVYIFII